MSGNSHFRVRIHFDNSSIGDVVCRIWLKPVPNWFWSRRLVALQRDKDTSGQVNKPVVLSYGGIVTYIKPSTKRSKHSSFWKLFCLVVTMTDHVIGWTILISHILDYRTEIFVQFSGHYWTTGYAWIN